MTQVLKSLPTNSAGWVGLIIGILGAVLIGIYVMPQCVKTIKTKDTVSISLGMFILGALGAFFFVLSAMINAINNKGDNMEMWLPTMLGNVFSCSASCVVLFFKIRNMKWAKKFNLKESEVPAHYKEIKKSLAKARAAKRAKKAAEKERAEIESIKKSTPAKGHDDLQ